MEENKKSGAEMWRAGFIPFASTPNFFLYHVTKPHSAIVHQIGVNYGGYFDVAIFR